MQGRLSDLVRRKQSDDTEGTVESFSNIAYTLTSAATELVSIWRHVRWHETDWATGGTRVRVFVY